ncbi:hypothetical protein C8Q70DRAFT_24369 [Cubamyces menziesii]|nr:hypothetical protein C8Q70DRAFT_24369 [Cubamyces menziesii]
MLPPQEPTRPNTRRDFPSIHPVLRHFDPSTATTTLLSFGLSCLRHGPPTPPARTYRSDHCSTLFATRPVALPSPSSIPEFVHIVVCIRPPSSLSSLLAHGLQLRTYVCLCLFVCHVSLRLRLCSSSTASTFLSESPVSHMHTYNCNTARHPRYRYLIIPLRRRFEFHLESPFIFQIRYPDTSSYLCTIPTIALPRIILPPPFPFPSPQFLPVSPPASFCGFDARSASIFERAPLVVRSSLQLHMRRRRACMPTRMGGCVGV